MTSSPTIIDATPVTEPVSEHAHNGKIGRLPRALRDRINLALYNRYPAKHLAQALNQMPEVKAILAQYFDGKPLRQQNISEWKQGGYRDWLHHRQILEQQRELTANAKDLADTANGLPESLFGMLTLNYADLMMNRDKETAEEFEKKRKELSLVSQDISRIHRCHINTRRVEVQEARLERDEEKTEEQLHFKFMEWVENPAIRRACILGPMEANRQTRRHLGLPPRPEDPLVEQLTKNDPYFNPPAKKQNQSKPKPTENTGPGTPPASDKSSSLSAASSSGTGVPPVSGSGSEPTPSSASEKGSESTDQTRRPMASPSPGGEGWGEGELNSNLNPQNSTFSNCDDKTSSQLISEIEAQHLRKKSGPAVPPASGSRPESSQPPASEKAPGPNNVVNDPIAVPSLGGSNERSECRSVCCSGVGQGEGELNSKLKTQNSSLSPTPYKNKTNPPIRPIRPISPIPPNSKLKTQPSTSPKPHLSAYDRALLAGKTFLEALYINSARPKPDSQPAPPPQGSSAWDSFSQKVDVYSGFRPAPAINLRSALGRNPPG